MPVEHIQVDVQPPSGDLRCDLPGGLAAALCRIVVEVSGVRSRTRSAIVGAAISRRYSSSCPGHPAAICQLRRSCSCPVAVLRRQVERKPDWAEGALLARGASEQVRPLSDPQEHQSPRTTPAERCYRLIHGELADGLNAKRFISCVE